MMEHIDLIINIVLLPVSIMIVLIIHEWGHYALARFLGISIDSFSIGCGKSIFKRKDKKGIEWEFRLYPVCGHVHLSDKNAKAGTTLFKKASPGQKAAIILAGPLANALLAFVIMFIFFASIGQPARTNEIAGVEPGQAAAIAGLQTGDVIVAVEGKDVRRYREVWKHTYNKPEIPLTMKIKRGDEIFETTLTPDRISYRDEIGIERDHGRMGVIIGHGMTDLMLVESVNGREISVSGRNRIKKSKDQIGRERNAARKALLPFIGQNVALGLESSDMKTHIYETYLDPELNAHLHDPGYEDYAFFFAGSAQDNFYLQLSMHESLNEAAKQTGTFIKSLVMLPFQLLPVDKTLIKPWVSVHDKEFALQGKIYEFVYRIALASIFIGLLNLIPFPGLDGSMILQVIVQRLTGLENPETSRGYKYTLLTLLSFLYLGMVMANIGDLPRYIENKIQHVTASRF